MCERVVVGVFISVYMCHCVCVYLCVCVCLILKKGEGGRETTFYRWYGEADCLGRIQIIGWEGREWGASRPEELLRKVQKAPVREKILPRPSPNVNLASSPDDIWPEESRSGLESHQMNQGARHQQFFNKPKYGVSSGLEKWMDQKYQGLQGYLRPILVTRRGHRWFTR